MYKYPKGGGWGYGNNGSGYADGFSNNRYHNNGFGYGNSYGTLYTFGYGCGEVDTYHDNDDYTYGMWSGKGNGYGYSPKNRNFGDGYVFYPENMLIRTLA